MFVVMLYIIGWQYNRLNDIKNITKKLHHDINTSLVIAKLAIEGLNDSPVVNDSTPAQYHDLMNILEEGIHQIEKSFKHWDGCIQ